MLRGDANVALAIGAEQRWLEAGARSSEVEMVARCIAYYDHGVDTEAEARQGDDSALPFADLLACSPAYS